MTDEFDTYRPILDLIGKSEGTDRGRGYNETLAYGAYTGGPVNLVSMTLAEVDNLQTKMLKHRNNKLNSSAVGRYQIIRTTLRTIISKLRLPTTAKFTALMQDRMACFLLGTRGIDLWLSGDITQGELINNLAREWASLPTTTGKGFYGGQHASVSVDEVKKALAEVRWRHNDRPPTKFEPIQPPAPKKSFWKRLLDLILRRG